MNNEENIENQTNNDLNTNLQPNQETNIVQDTNTLNENVQTNVVTSQNELQNNINNQPQITATTENSVQNHNEKPNNKSKIALIIIIVLLVLLIALMICYYMFFKDKIKLFDNTNTNDKTQEVENKNDNNKQDEEIKKDESEDDKNEDDEEELDVSCIFSSDEEDDNYIEKISDEKLKECGFTTVDLKSNTYIPLSKIEKPGKMEELKSGKSKNIEDLFTMKYENKKLYLNNKEVTSEVKKVFYDGQFDCSSWFKIYVLKDDGIYLAKYSQDGDYNEEIPNSEYDEEEEDDEDYSEEEYIAGIIDSLSNFKKITSDTKYVEIAEYWFVETCGAATEDFYVTSNGEYYYISDNKKLNVGEEKKYLFSEEVDYDAGKGIYLNITSDGTVYFKDAKKDIKAKAIFGMEVDDFHFEALITSNNLLYKTAYDKNENKYLKTNNKKIKNIYVDSNYAKEQEQYDYFYYGPFYVVYEDNTFDDFEEMYRLVK